ARSGAHGYERSERRTGGGSAQPLAVGGESAGCPGERAVGIGARRAECHQLVGRRGIEPRLDETLGRPGRTVGLLPGRRGSERLGRFCHVPSLERAVAARASFARRPRALPCICRVANLCSCGSREGAPLSPPRLSGRERSSAPRFWPRTRSGSPCSSLSAPCEEPPSAPTGRLLSSSPSSRPAP